MSRTRGAVNKETMVTWLKEYMKPGTVTVIVLDSADTQKFGTMKKITSIKAWYFKRGVMALNTYEVWQWKGCEGSFQLMSGTLANVHIFYLVPQKLKFVQPLSQGALKK